MTKKKPGPDDRELFRQTVGKVHPIKNNKILLQKREKPKPRPRPDTIRLEDRFTDAGADNIEKVNAEDTLAFIATGLQKSALKKLRQGQYGLDAEIDLHGLGSQDAKWQLLNFLQHSVQSGHRCVHIVHGKGHRSPDRHPVLKNNLNVWLRQHSHVLAFCSAPIRDGGAGAVYVLLRMTEVDR
ncbi:MAG: Smr/MutS family protein [Gammaproteobacteria bacterium]